MSTRKKTKRRGSKEKKEGMGEDHVRPAIAYNRGSSLIHSQVFTPMEGPGEVPVGIMLTVSLASPAFSRYPGLRKLNDREVHRPSPVWEINWIQL